MLKRMLYAVSFALADSVNALLIGVIVAIGIMLPRGNFRVIAPLLVIGDWFGVLVLSALTMLVLDSMSEYVKALQESPLMGWLLIAIGLATVILTWRSRSGETNSLVRKILVPLQTPSVLTFITGFVLGIAQSATSAPFYMGLIHLAAGDFNEWIRYGGLVIYASLALSLPAAAAIFVGIVRSKPESAAGRIFVHARENKEKVAKVGGYVVATFLVLLGVASLVGLNH